MLIASLLLSFHHEKKERKTKNLSTSGIWLKYTRIHRCGLLKGRPAHRPITHDSNRLAPSVVNPKITNSFSARISCRLTFQPIELRPVRNTSVWRKERTRHPCKSCQSTLAIQGKLPALATILTNYLINCLSRMKKQSV